MTEPNVPTPGEPIEGWPNDDFCGQCEEVTFHRGIPKNPRILARCNRCNVRLSAREMAFLQVRWGQRFEEQIRDHSKAIDDLWQAVDGTARRVEDITRWGRDAEEFHRRLDGLHRYLKTLDERSGSLSERIADLEDLHRSDRRVDRHYLDKVPDEPSG